MLEIDDDSRLGHELLLGGVRYFAGETPSEDDTATFYEIAVERLAALGIARYEISNFARPGFESRHNMKYWTLEPYAGFGADAHSFDGVTRSENPESVEGYIARTSRIGLLACPSADGARLAAPPALGQAGRPILLEERFFLGLRLSQGFRPEPAEWRHFAEPIARFLEAGLLETADGALRLTNRGVMLSNEVFQEFLPA